MKTYEMSEEEFVAWLKCLSDEEFMVEIQKTRRFNTNFNEAALWHLEMIERGLT